MRSVTFTVFVSTVILAPAVADAVPIWETGASATAVQSAGSGFDYDQDSGGASAAASASDDGASASASATVDPTGGFMMSAGAIASLSNGANSAQGFAGVTDTFFLASSGTSNSFNYELAIEGSADGLFGRALTPNGEFLDDPLICTGFCFEHMGRVNFSMQAGSGDALTGEGFSTTFVLEDLFNGDGSLTGTVNLPLSFVLASEAEWIQVTLILSVDRISGFGSGPQGTTDFGSTLSFGFSDPSLFSSRLSGASLVSTQVPVPGTMSLLGVGLLALAALRGRRATDEDRVFKVPLVSAAMRGMGLMSAAKPVGSG